MWSKHIVLLQIRAKHRAGNHAQADEEACACNSNRFIAQPCIQRLSELTVERGQSHKKRREKKARRKKAASTPMLTKINARPLHAQGQVIEPGGGVRRRRGSEWVKRRSE